MKQFLAAFALILGTTFAAYGQQEEHIRFLPGQTQNDGALQIAVTEFTKNNTKVTLYGVVHIADAAYYQQVQRDLDRYDSVLYEGVSTSQEPNGETKVLNTIQKLFGQVLGLTFQKDGISYIGSNMVHADISMPELQKSMGDEKLTPFGQYVKPGQLENLKPILDLASEFIKMYMDSNPQLRNSWKMQFATQLSQTDISSQLSPQMHKAIVVDRNKIVLRVLGEQMRDHPKKKNIAIFYGAGHNPDFVTRLTQDGWTQSGKRWMTAWNIGNGAVRQQGSSEKKAPVKKAPVKKKEPAGVR